MNGVRGHHSDRHAISIQEEIQTDFDSRNIGRYLIGATPKNAAAKKPWSFLRKYEAEKQNRAMLESITRFENYDATKLKPRRLDTGLEFCRQVAVDFQSDANLHECGRCPGHEISS